MKADLLLPRESHNAQRSQSLQDVCKFDCPSIGHRHRTRLLGFSATLDRTDGFFVEDALPHRVYHGRAEPLIDLGT